MDIPKPDYNLGIAGGSHGQMTAAMLMKIEEILIKEHPDLLLVFGDTNSTIAGALAAVKLHIPVCHVEAGNRLGTLKNPEEVNRIVTDHISSLHLACTASSVDFLKREGFDRSVSLVGDPMYDAFCYYSAGLDGSELESLTGFDGETIPLPSRFYYMTCHRQENTDADEKLDQILQAASALDAPMIYPVHPRNQQQAIRLCRRYANVIPTLPLGYKTSISLVLRSEKIVTDSGGLQREAFFAKKPCVTIFDYSVWPESKQITFDPTYQPFGNGHAAEKIAERITDYFQEGDK